MPIAPFEECAQRIAVSNLQSNALRLARKTDRKFFSGLMSLEGSLAYI